MTKEKSMTNPLDGIDDLLTEYAFAVSEHHKLRLEKQPRLAAVKQGEAKALRNQVREKVAKANLIINQGLAAGNVQRLGELHEAADMLAALENAGVDNWEGYADAMAQTKE